MLILSRRRDESIHAGVVTFTVVDIRGDRVRVGIEAPRSLPVHRCEVLLAIANQDPAELRQLGYELNEQGLAVPRRDLLDVYERGHKAA